MWSGRFTSFFSVVSIFSLFSDLKNACKVRFRVADLFVNFPLFKNVFLNINFLRKNKIFNKGRYSRNRQNYRTGVY
jgi:hypothetical protein